MTIKTPEQIASMIAHANPNASSEGWEKVYSAALAEVQADRAQRAEGSITIDLETGAWLSSTAITGGQGERVASSVLPGTTPEQVGKWYSDWMRDDPAPAFKVGDPDPTPSFIDTKEHYCVESRAEGDALWACTWEPNHPDRPHVAGDGETIRAVWS